MTATQAINQEALVAAEDVQRDSHRQRQVRDLAIESLVKETHSDVAKVTVLYDTTHDQLASQAKIKTYISVIATRLVRVALQTDSPRLQ